jgi:hypothetical protein
MVEAMREEMGVVLLDPERGFERIRERLLSGWILVTGDDECIMRLEERVYTPGTPKNADFETIVVSVDPDSPLGREGKRILIFYLAKKCKELEETLNCKLDDVIAVSFDGHKEEEDGFLWWGTAVRAKKEPMTETVDEFVEWLKSLAGYL